MLTVAYGVTLLCRLVPAYVQEEAWNSLAGRLEMGMKLKVRVHKVWLTFLFCAQIAKALRQQSANACSRLARRREGGHRSVV